MDVEDVDLEDLGEMSRVDFVTLGEESSNDDDLFESMVDSDMLGRDGHAQKDNIDPGTRKSKDAAKLLGAICTIQKADEIAG